MYKYIITFFIIFAFFVKCEAFDNFGKAKVEAEVGVKVGSISNFDLEFLQSGNATQLQLGVRTSLKKEELESIPPMVNGTPSSSDAIIYTVFMGGKIDSSLFGVIVAYKADIINGIKQNIKRVASIGTLGGSRDKISNHIDENDQLLILTLVVDKIFNEARFVPNLINFINSGPISRDIDTGIITLDIPTNTLEVTSALYDIE